MKRILIATMFVASAALAAENTNPKAEEAIKAVFVRVDTCLAKHDPKCLGELFADDATFAGPVGGGKIIKGKAQIVKAFEGMMKEPSTKGVKQERAVQNVRFVGEDRAFVDCSLTLSGTTAPKYSADDENQQQMWYSTALMVLKDGKWILEDVRFYVVQTPPMPTPAPLAAEPEQPAQPKEPAQPDAPPKS
jgi:uncharacterized protein (TIGR02246 family)